MLRYTIILVISLFAIDSARAEPIHNRMTIVEAIDAVRSEGYDISYSTQLVKEWMLVREDPAEVDPVAALRFALAEYALDLVAGDDGRWLIVEGQRSPAGVAIEAPPADPGPATTEAPGPRPLEEIIIVASQHALYSQVASDQFLSSEEIQLMPHMADDAFRALHRLPGVAASDFQAPFNLRGGAIDEVKIQLNGVELVEPFHMRTLFNPLSAIDPGIIGEARVYSGGFTARHGNFMSGVIDFQVADANHEPVHELGVSFVSAFARSSGRFDGGRGRYFVSARRGYLDLLADSITDEGEKLEPRYGDLYASIGYSLDDRLDISIDTLLAQDDVTFVDPGDGEDFGEDSTLGYVWLTADFEPGAGVKSATSLFAGSSHSVEDGNQLNFPTEAISRFLDREVDVTGIQTDWIFALGPEHVLEWGARYRELDAAFDYRLNAVRRSDFINNGAPFAVIRNLQPSSSGEDFGTYLSFRHRATARLIWELGVRWDRQTYLGDAHESQTSPRLNISYALNDHVELRAAWGDYYQPQAIQDLAVPDGDVEYYRPEQAEHRMVGLHYLFRSGLDLQVDVYDKRYRHLRPRYDNLLDIYEFAPESNFDRTRVEPSSGRAYGAELTLRNRSDSGFDWWVNYTWSKVSDTIDGISVPRSWDQRHAVTGNVIWRGDRWSVSAVARYHSGWPRTPLLVTPVLDDNDIVVGIDVDLTQRNTMRFDDYTRVDFRVTRHVPLARGSFEYYFEVFNVFNSANQCCTSNHRLDIGPSVSVSPLYDDYLPLFPSFGFNWRFGAGAVQ